MEGKKPKESVDLANFLSIKVISDDDTKRIKKLRQHLDKAFKIKYLVVKKKKGEQQLSDSEDGENDQDDDELGNNSDMSSN